MFWTKYTIHINTNSDTPEQDIVLKGNQTIPDIPLPIRRGYTFKGWFMDSDFIESFDLEKMVKKNITIHAKWQKYSLNAFTEDLDRYSQASTVLQTFQTEFEDVPDFKNPIYKSKKKHRRKKKVQK